MYTEFKREVESINYKEKVWKRSQFQATYTLASTNSLLNTKVRTTPAPIAQKLVILKENALKNNK